VLGVFLAWFTIEKTGFISELFVVPVLVPCIEAPSLSVIFGSN